jgi:ABC-2 type transport system permease protein
VKEEPPTSKENASKTGFSLRRLKALCWKETLQMLRDPSSNLIAFALPMLLMFVFGFGINLDTPTLKIGLHNEATGTEADGFAAALIGTPSMEIHHYESLEAMAEDMTDSKIRGFVVIPADFSRRMKARSDTAPVQVVADGS